MNKDNFLEHNHLSKYLEQIIFRKDELKQLAIYITQLTEGKISSEEYKTKLLESRVRILNDMTEFLKFYHKTKLNSEPLGKHKADGLEEELKNKTVLLEDIAKRLQKIGEFF